MIFLLLNEFVKISKTLLALLCLISLSGGLFAKTVDLSETLPINGVSGAADLYDRVGIVGEQVIYKDEGIWQLGPKLPVSGDSFTDRHVSVSKQYIAIGSRSKNTVWVFKRSGFDWHLMTTLEVPEEGPSNYGESVYVDDNLLAVADTIGQQVFVYQRQGDTWHYSTTLNGGDLAKGPYQSFGITIRKVKNELYISDSGSDRLFIFKNIKDRWQRSQVIEAPINLPTTDNQKFSYAFDVDRHTLAVSAYVYGSGYVQIYHRTHSTQPWIAAQTLYQADVDSDSGYFGHDVELDRSVLLVGDDELKKIYRFDTKGSQWQLTEILAGDEQNYSFGYSLGYDNGTLLVGAKQAWLYTRPFPKVTLAGRVLTQDNIAVKNAVVSGYLSHGVTNEYGDYALQVPQGWSGSLQATPDVNIFERVASQVERLSQVPHDTRLNDLIFESPYYVVGHIQYRRASCRDPDVTIKELADDAVRVLGRSAIRITTLYGWSGSLTPVSDLCRFSPASLSVDFMEFGRIFDVNTEKK